MKKFLISVSLIVAFAFYALLASTRSNNAAPIASAEPLEPSPSTPNAPVTSTTSPKQIIKFKDGMYTGPATDAYFGTIQVKAIISGGMLSDVTFLQYPNDRDTSIRISNESMPILKSEAINAQSSNVDIVSGATQTSQAFIQSLGSALASAIN